MALLLAEKSTQSLEGRVEEGLLTSHSIEVKSNTYDLYKEMMVRTGLKDDNTFINFLITAAMSKIQELNAGLSSLEDSDKKNAAEGDDDKERIEDKLCKEAIKTLTQPVEVTDFTSVELFKHIEKYLQDVFTGAATSMRITDDMQAATAIVQASGTNESMKEEGEGDSQLRTCSRCGRDRMTAEEMAEHQKHCNILEKYKHVKKAALPKFIYCSYCGQRLNSSDEYKRHFHQYHSNRTSLYVCEYCNKKQAFTEKRGLVNHKKTEPVCQHCKKRYSKVDTMHIHAKNKNHDLEKRRQVKSAGASRSSPAPTAAPLYDIVKECQPDNLPSGYSFMSVKIDPTHKLPGDKGRQVIVPETATRQGYALTVEFLNPPYPLPDIHYTPRVNPSSSEIQIDDAADMGRVNYNCG